VLLLCTHMIVCSTPTTRAAQGFRVVAAHHHDVGLRPPGDRDQFAQRARCLAHAAQMQCPRLDPGRGQGVEQLTLLVDADDRWGEPCRVHPRQQCGHVPLGAADPQIRDNKQCPDRAPVHRDTSR
jgi:hypothetical protein